jgi:phenylalanyl-tRNA synthetase beta chain
MEIKDVYPNPIENPKMRLDFTYVDNLIGKKIGNDTIKNILKSLEIEINAEDAEGLDITVPAYRVDVQRPCDVVEDILRIYGYNNVEIPTQLKSTLTVKDFEDQRHKLMNLVAEQLVGAGFNEILNNSLTKGAYYADLKAYPADKCVTIVNPLSSDLNVMRQSLLFGGLESIMRNANRRMPNLRFFEFGNCYQHFNEKKDDENPMKAYSEESHLGLWITGKRVEGSWIHADEDSTYYELKAHVDNILRRIGMPQGMLVCEKTDNDIFSTGIKMMNRGGKVFVEMGIVSKKLQKQADIAAPVYFADINWTLVTNAVKKSAVHFTEIPKYPAVSRDLALLLDKNIEFAQVEQIARQTEKKLLKKVELFDVYEGKNLPEGKKSYAVNFVLQDSEKTMNDKAIDAIMNKLINNLKKQLNCELR